MLDTAPDGSLARSRRIANPISGCDHPVPPSSGDLLAIRQKSGFLAINFEGGSPWLGLV
jgi:hypothetical protein